MMEQFYFAVNDPDDFDKRLDVYISETLDDYTRSAVKRLIDAGHIFVNGKPVKASTKLKQGDVVSVCAPEPVPLDIKAENIPLHILYEDDALIVVHKPKGMVVHPAAGHFSGTLVNALLYHCGSALSGINGVMRPGIVHRIDKDTSGVLVVAKTNAAHQALSLQLASHTMTRVYTAVVHDGMKEEAGTIDKPIGRHPTDRVKMAVNEKNGKRAVTHYKVLERLGRYTLIEARLETGRTHQIRVHMASIGHPLLGDDVYGHKKCPFHTQGQVLHARVLGFEHPVSRRQLYFETPLPGYFKTLLDLLRS